MTFVILRASNDYETMVRVAAECLGKMGVLFATNGDAALIEYEKLAPPYFRVVVEPNRVPTARNFPTRSISAPKGSTVEIRFGPDARPEDLAAAGAEARRFLNLLIGELPTKPWAGLGGFLLNNEEKKWKRSFAER